MVTRRDARDAVVKPEVTMDEALRIATINGAYASFEEKSKGSITAGKYADFVVLEKDPHDVDPNSIKDIRVVRTVVGGTTAHDVA
jgi:predicted amidohydrolase YtcJ